MANTRKTKAAQASTAAQEKASTTPNVAAEPLATCFAVAKAPSAKKKLYWAGFSVVSVVDGSEISPDLANETFRRESQAAFAWSESSLAALDGKQFSAAALENSLGLDFGDY